MSDYIGTIGKKYSEFEFSPEFEGFSKVIINVSEGNDGETLSYISGNDSGRTLEFTNPYGTQAMADNILASLSGWRYQPFTADGALVNPASEIGDAVTINGIYTGIYRNNLNFGRLMAADISAPQDEALDYEAPHLSMTTREITRILASTKARFAIDENMIQARVEKIGGDNASFGWTLTEENFILYSNSKTVFTCNENGISVDGIVKARSGYIGSDSHGFHIKDNAIYNGVESMSDTSHTGIYLGTDGICLGQGRFKVDSSGNLYAQSGTFAGTVYAGSIQYGGSAGTFSGYGLTGGTVGTGQCTSYLNGGIAGGYFSGDVFNGLQTASYMKASNLYHGQQRIYKTATRVKTESGYKAIFYLTT